MRWWNGLSLSDKVILATDAGLTGDAILACVRDPGLGTCVVGGVSLLVFLAKSPCKQGDLSCVTADCSYGTCEPNGSPDFNGPGDYFCNFANGYNACDQQGCSLDPACVYPDCKCGSTTTTTTSTTTTTTGICNCGDCQPNCLGLDICWILNAGTVPVDFTLKYCGTPHGNLTMTYTDITCPSGWFCANGSLSGAAAQPPNANPLYWPGVGSCSASVILEYQAVLSDSVNTSAPFIYNFDCVTGSSNAAVNADGLLVADPGAFQGR